MAETVTRPLFDLTAAPSVRLPSIEQRTRLSPDVLADAAGALNQTVRVVSEGADLLHSESLRRQLDSQSSVAAKRQPVDLLGELADLGFAWADIARIVGVSIPAVRKWRHGESVSGFNRAKLARLVALARLLQADHMISDVASWLEIPLAGSTFAGIDVLAAGRDVDVMSYAGGHLSASGLLDHAIRAWRDDLDDPFETYEAPDGEMAIRMRDQGGNLTG